MDRRRCARRAASAKGERHQLRIATESNGTQREQLFVQGQMACDAALMALLPALEQRINALLPLTAAKQLKEELALCGSKVPCSRL